MKTKKYIDNTIKYALLCVLSLTMIFPFLWMLSTSFKFDSQVFTTPVQWIPNPANLNNYVKVWTQIPLLSFYKNTIFVTITATALQVMICAMAAYAFAKLHFVGKNAIFAMYLATMMVPWHTIMIPQYMVMRALHLTDNLWALILGQLANAFGVFLLRQFFMGIPNDLREAAQIDGAGELRVFFKIMLPQAKPGLSALIIFTFITVWNDYLAPLIYINSKSKYTIQLGLRFFQSEHSMQYAVVMAGAVCSLLPILLVYMLMEKHITQGIAFTGIKG